MAAPEPVSRPAVHALAIAQPDTRPGVARMLSRAGMASQFADDPYAAMTELCRRPMVYRAVVLSLQGIYQEELTVISAIKRRFPHIDVFLSHTDTRQSAMAEGMRLGADGVVSDDGVYRTNVPMAVAPAERPAAPISHPIAPPPPAPEVTRLDLSNSEPLLTPEELRALLDDEPMLPPAVGGES